MYQENWTLNQLLTNWELLYNNLNLTCFYTTLFFKSQFSLIYSIKGHSVLYTLYYFKDNKSEFIIIFKPENKGPFDWNTVACVGWKAGNPTVTRALLPFINFFCSHRSFTSLFLERVASNQMLCRVYATTSYLLPLCTCFVLCFSSVIITPAISTTFAFTM